MKAPLQRIHTCSYCHGKVHIIDPHTYKNDVIAKKDAHGKWVCGDCQEASIAKMIAESKRRRRVI